MQCRSHPTEPDQLLAGFIWRPCDTVLVIATDIVNAVQSLEKTPVLERNWSPTLRNNFECSPELKGRIKRDAEIQASIADWLQRGANLELRYFSLEGCEVQPQYTADNFRIYPNRDAVRGESMNLGEHLLTNVGMIPQAVAAEQ
jgi:hypothetical protein